MPSATEQAVRRLAAALQSLEVAVQQRLSLSENAEGLSDEVQMLTADRAQLAESLDQAQARGARLEGVNHETSKRIAGAIETIRGVLAAEPERR
jgi:hypothetical protein